MILEHSIIYQGKSCQVFKKLGGHLDEVNVGVLEGQSVTRWQLGVHSSQISSTFYEGHTLSIEKERQVLVIKFGLDLSLDYHVTK